MTAARYWLGTTPTRCDLCREPIAAAFIDGRTSDGRWGIMCPRCRMVEGPRRLGTGSGQLYERQADGRWLKTGG